MIRVACFVMLDRCYAMVEFVMLCAGVVVLWMEKG